MRIVLGVEYDGTHFHGWQVQEGARTVQACLEQGLSRVADHPLSVICAGRTDVGVHATAQVVHFDTHAHRPPRAWVLGTNTNLPRDLSVRWAVPMPEDFHARFSATGRTYRYVILNRWTRPALLASRVCWECRSLDVDRMREASTYLLGEHDFSSFRALACQAKSPVRTVRRLTVERREELIYMEVEANAFLHHMVRNIAGVLLAIGLGKHPPLWAKEVLKACDRTAGGMTAPAQGLYLIGVDYPAHFHIPTLSSLLPGVPLGILPDS